MQPRCPQCSQPTPPNEMFAYGKCESCYNGDHRITTIDAKELAQKRPCGGGRRVIRSGKEMT